MTYLRCVVYALTRETANNKLNSNQFLWQILTLLSWNNGKELQKCVRLDFLFKKVKVVQEILFVRLSNHICQYVDQYFSNCYRAHSHKFNIKGSIQIFLVGNISWVTFKKWLFCFLEPYCLKLSKTNQNIKIRIW